MGDTSGTGPASTTQPGGARPASLARYVAERAGLLLVLAGAATTAAAPWLSWESDFGLADSPLGVGHGNGGGGPVAFVLLLGPLPAALVLAARIHPSLPGRAALLLAAAFLFFSGYEWSTKIPADARGPGGPALVAGAGALLAGWLARAFGPREPAAVPGFADASSGRQHPSDRLTRPLGGDRRGAWAWAAGLAAAWVAVASVLVAQFSVLQFTDHTEAGGVPAPAPAAAGGGVRLAATTRLWQTRQSSADGALAAGRFIVLEQAKGVTVLGAATGRELWHYRRRDASTLRAVVTPDDKFLVVLMYRDGDYPRETQYGLLAGFSLPTGRQLWETTPAVASGDFFFTWRLTPPMLAAGDTAEIFLNCGGSAPSCLGAYGQTEDYPYDAAYLYDAATGALLGHWDPASVPCTEANLVAGQTAAGQPAAAAEIAGNPPACDRWQLDLITSGGRPPASWRPPPGDSLAAEFWQNTVQPTLGSTEFPNIFDPTGVAAAPGGFLVPFTRTRPRGGWLVAFIGQDARPFRKPVPVGCPVLGVPHDPEGDAGIVTQSGDVLACASVARLPGDDQPLDAAGVSLRMDAQGVSLSTGKVVWRRSMTVPAGTYLTARGGVVYATTGSGSTAGYNTVALRAADGALLGQAPGYLMDAGPGEAILAGFSTPSDTSITITAFGG